jgi:hypothetical protein
MRSSNPVAKKRTTTRISRAKKTSASSLVAINSPQNKINSTSAHTLLWTGVTVSSFLILVVMAWSLKIQFNFLNWKNTPEKILLEKTTAQWQQTFTAVASESDLQKQIDKLDVQDALQLVAATTTKKSESTVSPTTTTTTTENKE